MTHPLACISYYLVSGADEMGRPVRMRFRSLDDAVRNANQINSLGGSVWVRTITARQTTKVGEK